MTGESNQKDSRLADGISFCPGWIFVADYLSLPAHWATRQFLYPSRSSVNLTQLRHDTTSQVLDLLLTSKIYPK